ncbi:YceI family protein [Angustibacter luteus]|uniref:YceI family protein n=1 Tax=Angustibacter luteus TaxID=658456 RepID=A0ABW1JG91_9ACTN
MTATATTLAGLTTGTWTIDSSHTEVGFVVRHMMVSKVKGRFSKVEGTITVAENVLESSVQATVAAASIDTRDDNRDNHLRSADFFDAETYPELTFASTGIRADGDDFLLDGDLTIKGVTRPVTFELEYNGAAGNPMAGGNPTAGFSAETEISRKDFGLEWNVALETGGVLVGDKVKLVLEVEAGKSA